MMGMDGMGLGMDDMWRTMYEVLYLVTTELRQISRVRTLAIQVQPSYMHKHTPHAHAHTHTHTHTLQVVDAKM